ncbi:MAG: RNA 2',3'-cyclic phosphodiesterase [bacterium]
MRLFIAIDLPEEWKEKLAQLQSSIEWLGRGISWARSEGMHLTLKFLGEVPEEKVGEIVAGLEHACEGVVPFDIRMRGTGCFPNSKRPRVYWAGLDGGKSVLELQAQVESEMEGLGFPREERAFTPHLTIARIKEPMGKERMTRALLDYKLETDAVQIREVLLMQSILKPTGAEYRPQSRMELKS